MARGAFGRACPKTKTIVLEVEEKASEAISELTGVVSKSGLKSKSDIKMVDEDRSKAVFGQSGKGISET